MDSLEPGAQSFIVKVWVEDNSEAGNQGAFRGHITHVTSHQRRYLKNLGEIEDFIAPYLEEMGLSAWRLLLQLTIGPHVS
ncbi:MAG: hypothetical protein ACXVCM_16490 [Ktedonobacteraceae bacterium]